MPSTASGVPPANHRHFGCAHPQPSPLGFCRRLPHTALPCLMSAVLGFLLSFMPSYKS